MIQDIRKIILPILIFSILLIPQTMLCKEKKQSEITFTETNFDFGNIREENGKVSHDFEFINSGKETVVILNALTTCGCVKADYPKHPIKAGENGHIVVTFNPKRYSGEFIKIITVRTVKQHIKLKITGVVIPKGELEE